MLIYVIIYVNSLTPTTIIKLVHSDQVRHLLNKNSKVSANIAYYSLTGGKRASYFLFFEGILFGELQIKIKKS